MFHVGGEQELVNDGIFSAFTNSGRSSLRLIIESAGLQGKHILLPNFLCEVVIDVLEEYDICCSFYNVSRTLEVQLEDNLEKYDALYVVNYFGSDVFSSINFFNETDCVVIVDDVFSPFPKELTGSKHWFSYNSLRKITPVADYSIVRSNLPLRHVEKTLPQFSTKKYFAKHLKYLELHEGTTPDCSYLKPFQEAELALDKQVGIFAPSERSCFESAKFYSRLINEQVVRAKQYETVKTALGDVLVDIESNFYSFAPILINHRDLVRKNLMKKNVFLAAHWPELPCVSNEISKHILSIPLDLRYSNDDIIQLCVMIQNEL